MSVLEKSERFELLLLREKCELQKQIIETVEQEVIVLKETIELQKQFIDDQKELVIKFCQRKRG